MLAHAYEARAVRLSATLTLVAGLIAIVALRLVRLHVRRLLSRTAIMTLRPIILLLLVILVRIPLLLLIRGLLRETSAIAFWPRAILWIRWRVKLSVTATVTLPKLLAAAILSSVVELIVGLGSMTLRYRLVDEVLGHQLLFLRANHLDLTKACLVLLVAALFHEDLRVAFVRDGLHGFQVAAYDEADLPLGNADAVHEIARIVSDEWIVLAD